MAEKRVCVFIDGSNVYRSAKDLGVTVDYQKLRDLCVDDRDLIRPYIYGALDKSRGHEAVMKQQNFYNRLKYLGFQVKTMPLRVYYDQGKVSEKFEKGVDVALVTEMLVLCFGGSYDIAVLVAGDKDYVDAVKAVKGTGRRVEIASFDHSCAKELRLVADRYISLTADQDEIGFA